jgi:hypothetical protein
MIKLNKNYILKKQPLKLVTTKSKRMQNQILLPI